MLQSDDRAGYKYIVFARDDLSEQIEGRVLQETNAESIAKFFLEDVIYWHRTLIIIMIDYGKENMSETQKLLDVFKMQQIQMSLYYPQSIGLVEYSHDALVNSITKYCYNDYRRWLEAFHLTMWVDRITVQCSTEYILFKLLYRCNMLLPIDLRLEAQNLIDWDHNV